MKLSKTIGIILVLIACFAFFFNSPQELSAQALRVLTGSQGGTGIGTATPGDVGDCLTVSDDAPFTYTLGPCGTGTGGGSSNWLYNGSRLSPSTTVGIGVFASSTISDLSSTNATATNMSVIGNTLLSTTTIYLNGGSNGNNGFKVIPTANYGASISSGGAINVNNTLNGGQGTVFLTSHGSGATGNNVEMNCNNVLFDRNCLNIDTYGTTAGLFINQYNNTSNTGYALGLASANTLASTMVVTGYEHARGTLKITHYGEKSLDSNSAALSIDLRATSTNQTGSQGIYIDSTTGSTTGNLMTIRQNGGDVFTLKPDGRLGFFNEFPRAMLDINGYDPATTTLKINAVSGQTANLFEAYDNTGVLSTVLSPLGFLGIGTTTPSNVIDVIGGINATNFKTHNVATLYASTTNLSVSVGHLAAPWLMSTSSQFFVTAIGHGALATTPASSTAQYNTAVGYNALQNNTVGNSNTALGMRTLNSNTTGNYNIAVGYQSLYSNTVGSNNQGFGINTLYLNNSGSNNIGIGDKSLYYNTTGTYNTGIGTWSGYSFTEPNRRSVVDSYMQFFGYNATRDASVPSTTPLSNGIAIGRGATVGCSNCVIFGATSSLAVNVGIGTTTPSRLLTVQGDGYFLNNITSASSTITGTTTTGNLILTGLQTNTTGNSLCLVGTTVVNAGGTTCITSSERFKQDIENLSDNRWRELLQMNTKDFNYREQYADPVRDKGGKRLGVIAEEVAKIDPALAQYDADGNPLTVHFDGLIALLIQATQAQQEQIDALGSKGKRAVTDNYQWIAIGALLLLLGRQQLQINKLK